MQTEDMVRELTKTTPAINHLKIRYAKKRGEEPELIDLAEFEKMLAQTLGREGFTWIEANRPFNLDGKTLSPEAEVKEFSHFKSLVVTETAHGKGVYTDQLIKAGTLVATYTGAIKPADELKAMEEKVNSYGLIISGKTTFAVLADKNGNMGSLFQYAPSKENLENYSFSTAEIKDKVATANLKLILTKDKNGQAIYNVEATRDIEAGEDLVWDYGNDYLAANKFFYGLDLALYDKTGNAIAENDYKRPVILSYRGSYQLINVEKLIELKNSSPTDDIALGNGYSVKKFTIDAIIENDWGTTHCKWNKIASKIENSSALEDYIANNQNLNGVLYAPKIDIAPKSFHDLGTAEFRKNNFEQAICYYLQAILIIARVGDMGSEKIKTEQDETKNSFYRSLATACWKLAMKQAATVKDKSPQEAVEILQKAQKICLTAKWAIEQSQTFISKDTTVNQAESIKSRAGEINSSLAEITENLSKAEIAATEAEQKPSLNCSVM